MKEIIITKNEENQRLDKFLLKYMNKASKGFIYKMLRKKRIKYNGGKAEGNELLRAGDTPVSYTHLDVYKRQPEYRGASLPESLRKSVPFYLRRGSER